MKRPIPHRSRVSSGRPELDDALASAIDAAGGEAPLIAGRCLRETREHPFELALASCLDRALPDGLTARTGGVPGLPDFPALGSFDVSASDGRARLAAVLEFKWWGPPGARSGVPAKRNETLWDVLKVACATAAGRAALGYVVVLAPFAAWRVEHPFARLFDGGVWETRALCAVEAAAMVYFDDRHYGVTAVPERVVTAPVASRAVEDPCHEEDWVLRAMAVEPRGAMAPLARPALDAA